VNIVDTIEREQMRADLPDFGAGDTVRVHVRVVEGVRERIQVFEGVVLGRRRKRPFRVIYCKEDLIWDRSRKDLSGSFAQDRQR